MVACSCQSLAGSGVRTGNLQNERGVCAMKTTDFLLLVSLGLITFWSCVVYAFY